MTSSRSTSISRLTYTLLNHAKLGQKLFSVHLRGGQKLLGQNDSTYAAQPSRDSTWRRQMLKA